MNYEQRLDLLKNQTFGKKVAYAFIVEASRILGDAASTIEAKAWAVAVLSDRSSKAQQQFAATLCVADEKIAEAGKEADDADVQRVVKKNLATIQAVQDK